MENFSKTIISESWQTQYIELKMSQDQLEQLDIQQDNITSQTRLLIPIVWIFSYTITSALFSRTIQIAENCCVVQLMVQWTIAKTIDVSMRFAIGLSVKILLKKF